MFSQANSALIGGLSFIGTLLGLAISLIGFRYTLIQLRRTKRAAQAASDAVKVYQDRVAASDSAVDATRVNSLLELCLAHLGSGKWTAAASALWEAERLLNRSKGHWSLKAEDLILTDRNVEDFLRYVDILEELEKKPASNFNDINMKSSIRNQISVVDQVIMRKHKEITNG